MLTVIRISLLSAFLVLATDCGAVQAGFDVGKQAYNKGDYAAALKEFAPLAKNGDPKAQHYLGQMYRHGRGVETDFVRGANWFHRAAKQGYAHAQYDLGLLFKTVAVTEGDYAKAVKWLLAASRQGHLEAQFSLGEMFRDGDGVEVDNVKALVLFIAAGKKMKSARGARNQLIKRMSKKDISRARNVGMAVFLKPTMTRSFASMQQPAREVKGKCGIAGSDLFLSSKELGKMAAELEHCLGEGWSGSLCTTQMDGLTESFDRVSDAAIIMKKDC